MLVLLIIFQYFIQSVVDLMDKFLISTRKIQPLSYTFFTVVTGAVLILAWPWAYEQLPLKFILLNLFSGAFFSLAMYVFFKALSEGEVSRVIPFIFALVPVFDVAISALTGRNVLSAHEFAAICLLVPGAMLISHQKKDAWLKHAGLKVLSAFLFSVYYLFWQYGAQVGSALNNLIWNRIGAALILVALLAFPALKKQILGVRKVKQKNQTSILFLFKQVLGGANFIFLSVLITLPGAKISIINGLQGFRYVFLLFLSVLLAHKRGHLIAEQSDLHTVRQKYVGVALIFVGVILLFIK